MDDTTRDPFADNRQSTGVQRMQAEGQDMPLLLRLQDIRKACKDWRTFSNDDPFMIVPHSEAGVRSVRQYPIETDPPDHTDYRALVEPFFDRPNDPAYQAGMRAMVDAAVAAAAAAESVEVVSELALPLQSRSLTRLFERAGVRGRPVDQLGHARVQVRRRRHQGGGAGRLRPHDVRVGRGGRRLLQRVEPGRLSRPKADDRGEVRVRQHGLRRRPGHGHPHRLGRGRPTSPNTPATSTSCGPTRRGS